jgi:hypothetical protein
MCHCVLCSHALCKINAAHPLFTLSADILNQLSTKNRDSFSLRVQSLSSSLSWISVVHAKELVMKNKGQKNIITLTNVTKNISTDTKLMADRNP